MKDKISVIIPIYNTAKYLDKCINSVINQTYKNLEIILVNDGSTDNSGKICDQFAQKDCRIKVIHKENGGASDARNAGIRTATGAFIGFVDSDDYIENDMYETLLNILYTYNADIVSCKVSKVYGEKILPQNSSCRIEEFNTFSALEELILRRKFKNTIWDKIYKKNLFQDIEFPPGRFNEDIFWTYKIFARAKKIVSVNRPKYYYSVHEVSKTSLIYLNPIDWFYGYKERLEFFSINFPALFNLAQKNFFWHIFKGYKQLGEDKYLDKDKKYRKKIKDYIFKNYKSLRSNPLIGRKSKLLLKIFLMNPKLSYFLFNYYKIIKLLKRRLKKLFFTIFPIQFLPLQAYII